jgi:ABC-type lipoprotein export system ATPase subunit
MSGGDQQRVAVARALANDPPLLLADEPTGNLDSRTSREIMELLASLNRDGKTIVMVTHDASLAAQYAHRTVSMLDGTIVGAYGRRLGSHAGLCLETQHFPDSPNQPQFPSTVLRPGDHYHSRARWRFTVD